MTELNENSSLRNRIPERSEVPVENTWRLEDIFPTDEDWEKALAEVKEYLPRLESFKGRLMSDGRTLYEFLTLDDELSLKLEAVYSYAMMKSDQDAAVSKYLGYASMAWDAYVMISSATSFVTPEIIAASDERTEELFSSTPELELYRRAISLVRAKKEHTLSQPEEAILAAASRIMPNPSNAYEVLESADLKFPDIAHPDGSLSPLTNGSFIAYMESPDRDIRRQAFTKLYNTYEGFKNTMAALYFGEVKTRLFEAQTRRYMSTLELALSQNEVPVSVYHSLIEAVHNNLDKLHSYTRLRKKLLGVDELHMYDMYTSLVPEADLKISYEQAKNEVYDAMAVLGEEYQSILREGFESRWIDVYENKGKRSGAYSNGARPHPYVLLNHKDTLDSEFTLAHEMGHSIHSYLSAKHQPVAYSNYVIFVAEVASTCNEALLMDYLLSRTTDKSKRAYLINYFLEQFRTTLFRQTMFAEFELITNEMAERGESLTADALCELYHSLNEKYYGSDVVIDREIDFEWERIPHFYSSFYVFQYATGFSAAVALSQRILKEGEPAVRDYLSFLSKGSSTDPISLLKLAGVDMSTPQPVNYALSLFGSLIEELDSLIGGNKGEKA